MGRRVIAIDGGEEKRKLCMELGAEAWIDYTQSNDIVGDIKKLTEGRGAHAAIVTTASVRVYLSRVYHFLDLRAFTVIGVRPSH